MFYVKRPFWERFSDFPKTRQASARFGSTYTKRRQTKKELHPETRPGCLGNTTTVKRLQMRPQTRLRGAMEKTKLENLTRRPRKPSTRPAGSGKGSLGKSTPAKAEGRPRGDQVPLAAAIFLKGWPQFRLKPIISNPRHRRHVTLRALLTARPARSGPREKGELVRSTPSQNTRNCP